MSFRNLTADNLPADYQPADISELQTRLEIYVDLLEYNRTPVTEMVYDERFRSQHWDHDVYVTMTADLRALLEELKAHQRVMTVTKGAYEELQRLAPVDENGETQWGKTPMETRLADLGRELQRLVEGAWRGEGTG